MEGAFGWLGDLFRLIGSLFPRWIHVDQTEIAIILKRGLRPRVLSPGLWFYWPFWTACIYESNQLRVPRIECTVRTKDGQTIRIGCRIAYTLWESETAIKQSLFKTEDVIRAVPGLAETVVAKYAASHEEGDLTDVGRANKELTDLGRARLRSLGAEVQGIEIVDIAIGTVLIHEIRHGIGLMHESEE